MLLRQFCLGNNLPTHIKKSTDFPRQKPRKLPNAEVNIEGCCYAGTALWFNLFNVFLHFKHDIGLFTKINFLFVSYLLYFHGPYKYFQLTFSVSRVTSVGTVYWRNMSLVTIELIDLMFQFVCYPLIIYISLLILVYYVCHCNFNFFCNWYIIVVTVFVTVFSNSI